MSKAEGWVILTPNFSAIHSLKFVCLSSGCSHFVHLHSTVRVNASTSQMTTAARRNASCGDS